MVSVSRDSRIEPNLRPVTRRELITYSCKLFLIASTIKNMLVFAVWNSPGLRSIYWIWLTLHSDIRKPFCITFLLLAQGILVPDKDIPFLFPSLIWYSELLKSQITAPCLNHQESAHFQVERMNLKGCFEPLDLTVGSPPTPGAGAAVFETLWGNHWWWSRSYEAKVVFSLGFHEVFSNTEGSWPCCWACRQCDCMAAQIPDCYNGTWLMLLLPASLCRVPPSPRASALASRA